MTADEPALLVATLATLATVGRCIETGEFGPGIDAMEGLRAAGYTTRPATQLLADTCFRLELQRWPRIDDFGLHFRGTVLLHRQGICTVREVNTAVVAALLERAKEQGFLEGELHTMLSDVASQSGSEIFPLLVQKIPRGDDSGFTV
jgi:hypothetical protein